jgi:hypothetical protein
MKSNSVIISDKDAAIASLLLYNRLPFDIKQMKVYHSKQT